MKRSTILTAILALLLIPQLTFSSDLDEFKAAVEKHYQAYNSMDVDTIVEMEYPWTLMIESNVPFPQVYPTAEASREALQNWFSTLESLNFFSIDRQYKVVGNTGIVWGFGGSRMKRKDGSVDIRYGRETHTWVKSGGKWRVLTTHLSKFPLDSLK